MHVSSTCLAATPPLRSLSTLPEVDKHFLDWVKLAKRNPKAEEIGWKPTEYQSHVLTQCQPFSYILRVACFSTYCSIYYLPVPSIANSQSEKNLILSWFWLLSWSWTHLQQGFLYFIAANAHRLLFRRAIREKNPRGTVGWKGARRKRTKLLKCIIFHLAIKTNGGENLS